MSALRRIGELAEAAGVPTSTVRFYERRGLLPADARSPAKYRLYGELALERLRFIRLAQSTGFTLEHIAALLELREEQRVSPIHVRAILTSRLDDVRCRLAELLELERVLKSSLDACTREAHGMCCPVMQRLTVGAAGKSGDPP
jgi:DNA-binding transcriptional MerR regulator